MSNGNQEFKLRLDADGSAFLGTVNQGTVSWTKFRNAGEAAGAAAAKAGQQVKASGDEARSAEKSYSSLTSTISRYITVAVSAIGIGAMIKKGLNFNAELADARAGLATVISATNELRDATGRLITGPEAFNAALTISQDQLKKLQVEGVNTRASFAELSTTFRSLVAPAQAVGMSFDQTRKLTVQMAQAGDAMGLSMGQVATETRGILNGNITVRNQLAQTLGISKEMVEQWTKQGTLAQELEKRTKAYADASGALAETWRGMVSSMGTALTRFSSEVTEKLSSELGKAGKEAYAKIFDADTSQLSAKLTPLVETLKSGLGSVGEVIGKALNGIIDGAIRLSEWIGNNKEALSGISQTLGKIFDIVVKFAGFVGGIVLDFVKWTVESGALETALTVVAGVLSTISGVVQDTVGYFLGTSDAGWTLNTTIGALVISYYGLIAAQNLYNSRSSMGFAASIKNIGLLKIGFGVLFAAVAGWQIGTELREKFLEVRLAGIALVNGLLSAGEHLKYGFLLVWERVKTAFTEMVAGFETAFGNFLLKIASGLEKIPKLGNAAAALKSYADEYLASAAKTETFAEAQIRLKKELDENLAKIDEFSNDMVDYEIAQEQAKKATNGTKDAVDKLDDALGKVTTTSTAAGNAAAEAAKKAAEEWDKYLKKVMDDAKANMKDAVGLTQEQYKKLDALWKAYTVGRKEGNKIVKLSAEAFRQEAMRIYENTDAYKENKKAIDDTKKALEEESKKRWKAVKDLENELEKLKFHNETLGMSKEAVEKLKLARMEERLENLKSTEATQGSTEALKDQIAALEALIGVQKKLLKETASGEAKEKQLKDIEDMKKAAEKAADDINRALTDAIMRGFESGKSFAQNFRDSVVNMFKTMVLQPIVKFTVEGGMNMLGKFLGYGDNQGMMQSITSFFGKDGSSLFSNLASLGSSVYSFFSGAASTGISSGVGAALSSGYAGVGSLSTIGAGTALDIGAMAGYAGIGNLSTIGASTVPTAAAATSGGAGASGGMSAMFTNPYAWIAAAVVAAVLANNNMYDKGWDIQGQRNTVLPGMAGILGPGAFSLSSIDQLARRAGLGGRMASILGGTALMTRIFGMRKPQMRSGGVEGTLSLDGFEGRQFQDVEQSGGFLRGNRHWTEWDDIDPELQKILDKTIGAVPKKIKSLLEEFDLDFGDVFGEDWSEKIRAVLTTDGKWENFENMLDKETTRIYREMATTAAEAIREGWGEYVEGLKDLEPEEFQVEIAKIIGSLSILKNIKGAQEKIFGVYGLVEEDFEKYAEKGEKIYETISRLAQTFTLTNKFSDFTGVKFDGIGLDSAEIRQAFIDEAGGPEMFAELFNAYWGALATETERFALAGESLVDVFDQIGVSVPRTVEAYKDLIAAQDMNTEEGRKTAQQLMQALGIWQQTVGALDALSKSMDATIANLRRSFEFDGLSNDEKYAKLKKEADDAYIEFQQATDPAEIQRLFDRITTNMGETWNLLTDDQKRAMRDQYLAKLDELEASKNDRIDAAKEMYTGVDLAEKSIVDAGNTLAQAILDVAGQLGADVSDIVLKPPPEAIDDTLLAKPEIDPLDFRNKPYFEEPLFDLLQNFTKPLEAIENTLLTKPEIDPLDFRNKPYFEEPLSDLLQNFTKPLEVNTAELSAALEGVMRSLPLDLKPLLLDDDPDAAFIAARMLIQEAAEQQGSSAEAFSDSIGTSAETFFDAVARATAMQQQAGSNSAAALNATAASLYALAVALQDQASASQQQTQKIRASELN
ncbi:MAG: hypothetical protein LBI35_01290 [Burkholderiales bacterium]|jgi:hypothetical protein|nr:hypothetical protein [Burkholderiales bacterium]